MASVIKRCFLVTLMCIVNLALTCEGPCRCSDVNTTCGECVYEVQHRNEGSIFYKMCRRQSDISSKTLSITLSITANYTVSREKGSCVEQLNVTLSNVTVQFLNMSNNNLRSVRIISNSSSVNYIDLSMNKISELKNDTFKKISELSTLDLSSNEINYFESDCFFGLESLKYLDLSNNNLTNLTTSLHRLKNLVHLNLSRNNLETLMEESFSNALLQHLDVTHNKLTHLSPGALQFLPNLARLLLTDNPGLGKSQMDGQLLLGTGRRLQQVDASQTGLFHIPQAFTHSVRFLSLSRNQISSIRGGDLDSYPLLQSLDFTENCVKSVEDDSFGRLDMLLFLNLNKNLLDYIPKMMPDELKYLSISDNFVRNLSSLDFQNLPSLKILLLQNNKIEYIYENVFEPLTSLEVLDLSNNPIKILNPSTFKGPASLKDLRLCYLNISLPEKDLSFPVPSPEGLQLLHLQSSPGLARQLLADSAVLAALSHLQYLDLRMNHLKDVRSDLIFYLSQLRTLRLHGNNINCTSTSWLHDWISWDRTSLKNETCYFSTIQKSNDDIRFNCTFTESFTITNSLPPVSLYSTEMINKLLKYYGYADNRTSDKQIHNNDTIKNTKLNLRNNDKFNNSDIRHNVLSNEIESNGQAVKQPKSQFINNYKIFKVSERLIKTSDNYRNEEKILGTKIQPTTDISKNMKRLDVEERKKGAFGIYKTEKTVNKAINNTDNMKRSKTKIRSTDKITQDSIEINQKNKMSALTTNNPMGAGNHEVSTIQDKSQSSAYQANSHSYVSYVGAFVAISLLLVGAILWASVRSRHRRRRRSINPDNPEHIEVANISGGVLW